MKGHPLIETKKDTEPVDDKAFDLWLQTNYQPSDFEGFWIDLDVWKDKYNPMYTMEELELKYSQLK